MYVLHIKMQDRLRKHNIEAKCVTILNFLILIIQNKNKVDYVFCFFVFSFFMYPTQVKEQDDLYFLF